MAEETTRKLKYLGLEYNEGVADFLALNAEAYARHLHLNDVLRNAFMQEVHGRLGAMRNGGDGATPISTDVIWTGAITGNLKSGPKSKLGISRNGFSASDLANSFFSGGIGRYNTLMREKTASDELKAKDEAKAKLLTWSKHTGDGGSTLGSRLRGMWGNDLDMVHWADSSGDTLVDGVRSRTGRYAALNKVLSLYRNDLLGGKWGDPTNNEDMQNELSLLNDALDNGDPGALDAAYQRLLGNEMFDRLMFTGEKYMTPEDITKAEQDTRLQLARDYEHGVEGVINPYEEGTEEYNALEARRKHADDLRFNESFGNDSNWLEGESDYTYTADLNDSLDLGVFLGWQGSDMRANLDAMQGKDYDLHGRDVAVGLGFEFGHNDYAGWKDGFLDREDESLEGTIYKNYIDSLKDTTNLSADDTFLSLGKNARSTNAVKAKAAMDWARALVSQPLYQQLQYEDGYIIPELIDWNTGKAYIFSFNGTLGRAKRVNLKSILPKLDKNSVLYKTLLNEYRVRNNRAAMLKEGGVLKAAKGAPLSPEEIQFLLSSLGSPAVQNDPFYNTSYQSFNGILLSPEERIAAEDARYAEALENGVRKLDVIDRNNSKEFSTTDWARIGTAVADLTGAVFSFSGFTPVGAAIGASSTLAQFGLDIADHDVSMTDALKGLGIGLGLSAATLLPGGGGFAAVSKAAKTLSKYAVPIISMMQVAGNSPEAIATAKKVFSGDFKNITVGEWKGFTKALNGLTNMSSVGKMAYSKRFGKFSKLNKPEGTLTWKYKIGNKEVELTADEIKAINESKNPEALLKAKFNEGPDAIADADVSAFIKSPNKVMSKLGAKSSLNLDAATVVEGTPSLDALRAYVKLLQALAKERNAAIRAGKKPNASLTDKIKGRLTEYGLDDTNEFFGGNSGNLLSLLRGEKPPKKGSLAFNLALKELRKVVTDAEAAELAAKLAEELKQLETLLQEGNLNPTDLAKILKLKNNLEALLIQSLNEWRSAGGLRGLRTLGNKSAKFNLLERLQKSYDLLGNQSAAAQTALADAKAAAKISAGLKASIKTNQELLLTLNNELTTLLLELKAANKVKRAASTTRKKTAATKKYNEAKAKVMAKLQEIALVEQKLQGMYNLARQEVANYRSNVSDKLLVFDRISDARQKLEYNLLNPTPTNLFRRLGIRVPTTPGTGANILLQMFAEAAEANKINSKRIRDLQFAKEVLNSRRPVANAIAERQKTIDAITTPYSNAVLTTSGNAVTNQAQFERFLDILRQKGYSERDLLGMLKDSDRLSRIKAIFNFKKGGNIHKLSTGGITQTSNILPLLDGVKKLNTFVSNNGLSALELIKHSLAVSQNKRAIDTLNSVQAPLYSFTPLSYKVNTSLVDLPYRRAADKMRSSADTAANKYTTSEARLATKLLADNLANDYELQGALATSLRLAQELAKMLEVENKNAQMADAINRQNTLLAYSKRLSDANNTAALDRFKVSQNELLLLQIQKGMATTAESKRKLAKIEALNNDEEYNILKTAAADAKTRYDADPENAELKKAYLDAVAARNKRLALFLADYDLANPALPLMPFASIRGIQAPETPYWQTVALKNEKGGSIGKLTQAELVKLFRQLLTNKTKEKKAYLDLLNKYAERMHKGNKSEAYSMYLKLLNK